MGKVLALLVYVASGLAGTIITLGVVRLVVDRGTDGFVTVIDTISVLMLTIVNPTLLVVASIILMRRQLKATKVLVVPLMSTLGLGVMLLFSMLHHSSFFHSWLFGLTFLVLFFFVFVVPSNRPISGMDKKND